MNISIDTLSRALAGNEIDRVQKGDLENRRDPISFVPKWDGKHEVACSYCPCA